MAGILKVGGVPLATHSDSTAKISLDGNVQFPAGHIIQTVRYAYDAENSDTYNSSGTFEIVNRSGVQSWKGTITNVQVNSHVLIKMIYFITAETAGRVDMGYSTGIYKESTLIYGDNSITADNYEIFGSNTNSNNQINRIDHIVFTDTSPATGTNNYFLGFNPYANTTLHIRSKSSSGYKPFECILQEIAQ